MLYGKMGKRVLSVVLAAVMLLGPAALAANRDRGPAASAESTKKFDLGRPVPGAEAHKFQRGEKVRAIVLLESAPLAETRYALASTEGAAYTARLRREQSAVRTAMRAQKVDFELGYEFDTLVNGFSCDVAYGDLAAIAALPGVRSVHIANQYSIPTPQEPSAVNSGSMTGNTASIASRYDGQGTVVAVLDSGVNLDHIAFQDYGNLGSVKLTKANIGKVTTPGRYVNAKVPFAYDYADRDNDPTDDGEATEGHGTHVSGIAVGYAKSEDGAVTFTGAAPAAQLLAMKIFGTEEATTSSDIYFKALEDALKLGADVINMSIGSDSGFVYDDGLDVELGDIYDRLEAAGVVVCVSAGNSNTMGQHATKGYISPNYADYGVVGSPATYSSNIAVASAENSAYPQAQMKIGGEASSAVISFADTSNTDDPNHWTTVFGGRDVEYVIIPNAEGALSLGTKEDFDLFLNPASGSDPAEGGETTPQTANSLEGKIAVVSRGAITFSQKVKNAARAGAAGVVVVNNQPGTINMSVENFYIPAVSVMQDALEDLTDAGTKTLYTAAEEVLQASSTAGQISDFSSWGPTPNLTMRPTLTSIGGNLWSADWLNDEGYQLMSGTSMASPNLAGTFANLLQCIRKTSPSLTKVESAAAARALMESTAELLEDADNQIYSVRAQGAGLGRSDLSQAAWTSGGYVTNPIHELGDSEAGTYSFTVTLKNNTGSAVTYTPSALVMTDTGEDVYADDDSSDPANYRYTKVKLQSTYLYDSRNGADSAGLATVTYSAGSVTVPANGTAEVTVSIALTDAGKQAIADSGFVNGSYVEGYVFFKSGSLPVVHASFLGFYGDWIWGNALEPNDFQDYLDAQYMINTTAADKNGYTYADYGYTPYDLLEVTTLINDAWVAKFRGWDDPNPVSGFQLGSAALSAYEDSLVGGVHYAPYSEANNMLSTNVEATGGYVNLYAVPALVRNAKRVDMVVTGEDGTVYYRTPEESEDDINLYIPKGRYSAGTGSWTQFSTLFWNGTDRKGDPLPDGATVHVTFDVTLPYGNAVQENAWQTLVGYDEENDNAPVYRSGFYVTMDSTAPEILSTRFLAETVETEDGEKTTAYYIEATVDEANLDSAYLATEDDDGGDIVDYFLFTDPAAADKWEENADGTVTFRMEVRAEEVERAGELYLGVLDYAKNETGEDVILSPSIGKSASVVLHTPQGTSRRSVKTGEFFEIPECNVETTEGDAAAFAFWYPEALDGEISKPELENSETFNWDLVRYPGEKKMISGDVEYYAVYLKGEKMDPKFTHYADQSDLDDYSGTYLFGGYGLDEETYEKLPEQLYVLNGDGTTLSLSDPDVNLFVEPNLEFVETDSTSACLTLALQPDGTYTIKTASNKYLAHWIDRLVLSDTPVKWTVTTEKGHLLVCPADDSELLLLFNDELDVNAFQLMDSTTPYQGQDYPSYLFYSLALYRQQDVTVALTNRVYTTGLTAKSGGGAFVPTETTAAQPSGATVEKTTDAAQNVVIKVTDASGEVVAEVKIPAVIPESETRFADVPEGHWADKAIHQLAAIEVVKGISETQFNPVAPMKRGDLATVLFRLSNGKAGLTDSFSDVAAGKYYADGIAWAAKAGVVQGYSDTEFQPETVITREQLAVMLMRYAKLLGVKTEADSDALSAYTDAASTHTWAADAMAWCVKSGIIQGMDDTTLSPTTNVTRAQVAVMLNRFLGLVK